MVVSLELKMPHYFNKSAKDLTLSEATILAGIPSTNLLFPFSSEDNAKNSKVLF